MGCELRMERLTQHGLECMSGLRKAIDPCRDVCNSRGADCFDDCPIQEAFNRLSAYEDTNMMPEEIAAMKAENERLNKLVDAVQTALWSDLEVDEDNADEKT